jgi:hypothetical protein
MCVRPAGVSYNGDTVLHPRLFRYIERVTMPTSTVGRDGVSRELTCPHRIDGFQSPVVHYKYIVSADRGMLVMS